MFDVCRYKTNKRTTTAYFLRFDFENADNNRFVNIEQIEIMAFGTGPPPRSIRRMINNKDSLDFYFKNEHEFLEKWQERYLLATIQQVNIMFISHKY